MQDNKRVAIYCRVSTGEQNTDRQQRDLLAFCQRAGFEVVAAFTEIASGSKQDRPERAKVIALAQARKIDAIVVTELTRWGRSTIDLLKGLQDLKECNVSLIAEKGDQFDLSTAQGEMIAGVLSVFAQFERNILRERTRSGLANAKAKGKKLGRPAGARTIEKHRQAVTDLLGAGFNYRDIAAKLKIGKDTVGAIARTRTA